MTSDIKTLDEFLEDNPNVDVSKAWERSWGILSAMKAKIAEQFTGLELDANCVDREYYTSPDKAFEGSMNAWSGDGIEWLVNSWIGNRKASILDMNCTAFLGQETDVPHFVMVIGTVPNLFMYFDYTPRRDIRVDSDYLDKYYGEDMNRDYLELRGNTDFQWAVSHGNYMRALLSPAAISMSAELNEANLDIVEDHAWRRLNLWLKWLEEARKNPVPEADRPALQKFDHQVRRLGYERDPMNKLAANIFGEDEVENLIRIRMGKDQMAKNRIY